MIRLLFNIFLITLTIGGFEILVVTFLYLLHSYKTMFMDIEYNNLYQGKETGNKVMLLLFDSGMILGVISFFACLILGYFIN